MDYVLLDLDGTITDSSEGIIKCFQYALGTLGIEVEDPKELEQYIGPPLDESFRVGFGMDEDMVQRAIALYRERYLPTGIYENKLYPGMERALERLKEAGKTLIVATSKPEHMAVRVLKHFGVDGLFDGICGADSDTNRNKKDEIIRYALDKFGVTDLSNVIMVGDRKYDVIGAKKCGLSCMGVLYGFGNREELEEAGAVMIAETVEDMAELLISEG